MEAHNQALRLELDYLQSKGFLSSEARRLLNLGLPGEHVLIIPPGAEAALPPALREKPAPAKPPGSDIPPPGAPPGPTRSTSTSRTSRATSSPR